MMIRHLAGWSNRPAPTPGRMAYSPPPSALRCACSIIAAAARADSGDMAGGAGSTAVCSRSTIRRSCAACRPDSWSVSVGQPRSRASSRSRASYLACASTRAAPAAADVAATFATCESGGTIGPPMCVDTRPSARGSFTRCGKPSRDRPGSGPGFGIRWSSSARIFTFSSKLIWRQSRPLSRASCAHLVLNVTWSIASPRFVAGLQALQLGDRVVTHEIAVHDRRVEQAAGRRATANNRPDHGDLRRAAQRMCQPDYRVRPIAMRAGLVIDPLPAPHQAHRLLDQRRQIQQLDLPRVEDRLQRLVQIGLGRGDVVTNPLLGKVDLESVAGEAVARHLGHAVLTQQPGEMRNRSTRAERRATDLLLDAIDHDNTAAQVADRQHGVVGRAAAHVDERAVGDARL